MSVTRKNLTYYKNKAKNNTLQRDEMDIIIPLIDERLGVLKEEERELTTMRQAVKTKAAEYDKELERDRLCKKMLAIENVFGPDVQVSDLCLKADIVTETTPETAPTTEPEPEDDPEETYEEEEVEEEDDVSPAFSNLFSDDWN